ncbi:dipeptide transporter; permease component, membrane component of ABC superfamily [Candidatus Bipolaricaulis anaerobius]|uniref:Dipeptide transporter permease component, membrane component of ABC superfamily n=1 Tax=Candidatus Bipolaricaulis anaerobius TaxID=2026885 RepID=A0A2X3K562_9BACT|nr:nickel ABC transporter permease [Candidatus Bipolaricaulis anaerobius]SQD92407.1 dipeptide transporter; permease component, membrane component of ABC superfamily [Candidatus Bipolaricaulis anaerobius]
MSGYILRRLGQAVPVLLGVTFVVFLLMYLTPGDPVQLFMGQAGIVSQEEIERVRHEFGLDRPFVEQYGLFLGGILRGNLGQSIIYRRPVATLIGERLPATIELTLFASLIALLVAIPAGVVAAVRRNTWLDAIGTTVSLLGVSLPGFWLGLILIFVFSVMLKVLPVAGRASYGTGLHWQTGFLLLDAMLQGNWPAFVDILRHLVMPALALSAGMMAMTMRLTRSSLLETIHQDYVRTAQAKGLPQRWVILRHALRNALLPVVTAITLNVGALLGGNMVVETVFSWPGLGRLVVEAVESRDYPLIRGCVLVYAVTYVFLNLIADLSYARLDPRVAAGGGKR